MIRIAAPATKDVLALLRRDEIQLDGLMVPQSMGKMATLLRSDFPDLPLHAHLSTTVLSEPNPLPRTVLDPIVEFVQLSETTSVSAHLGYNCSQITRGELSVSPADRAQTYVPASARRTIVANARLLSHLLGKPMHLENRPTVGRGEVHAACGFVCESTFVRDTVEGADCGLVLDLAHARVTAAHLGIDIFAYLESLPLARVTELHVSGPREMNGMLSDAHHAMQIDDYELLDWVLVRCSPERVTLEYTADRQGLPEQLFRLRRACERRGT